MFKHMRFGADPMLKFKSLKCVDHFCDRRQPNEEFKLRRSWLPSDQLVVSLALEFGLPIESIRSVCQSYIPAFVGQNYLHEPVRASSWDRKFIEFMSSAEQNTNPQTANKLKQFRKTLKATDELLRLMDRGARSITFVDWDHGTGRYEEYCLDPDFSNFMQRETANIPLTLSIMENLDIDEVKEYQRAYEEAALAFRVEQLKKISAIKKRALKFKS